MIKQANAASVPARGFELRQDHELLGRIALAEGRNAEAVQHLEQANQQDPRVLLLLARAHRANGDAQAAAEFARQAGEFNQLAFPLSYVRGQARELVEGEG